MVPMPAMTLFGRQHRKLLGKHQALRRGRLRAAGACRGACGEAGRAARRNAVAPEEDAVLFNERDGFDRILGAYYRPGGGAVATRRRFPRPRRTPRKGPRKMSLWSSSGLELRLKPCGIFEYLLGHVRFRHSWMIGRGVTGGDAAVRASWMSSRLSNSFRLRRFARPSVLASLKPLRSGQEGGFQHDEIARHHVFHDLG